MNKVRVAANATSTSKLVGVALIGTLVGTRMHVRGEVREG